MSFASDAFAGTLNTELATYSAAWVKITGYTQDMHVSVGGQYAIRYGASLGAYRNTGTPPSADYTVSASMMTTNEDGSDGPPRFGVCGRVSSSAQTMYFTLQTRGANTLKLYKVVAGSQTELASVTNAMTTSVAQTHTLSMVGTAIKVLVNASEVISVTDGDITAAGFGGIIADCMRISGDHDVASIDNWDASEIGGGPVITGPNYYYGMISGD